MKIEIAEWVDTGEFALTLYLQTPTQPDYPVFFNALLAFINTEHDDKFIEVVPSYHSCLFAINGLQLGKTSAKQIIEDFIANYQANPTQQATNLHHIPLCYEAEFAPDLPAIAAAKGLSVDEIIELHSKQIYTVYSLGFIPGFAFLGYVDDNIAMPRHLTPRSLVPGGSVGIAGKQTGIYPKDSPGGWQIIGKTPITLYAPQKNIFSLFSIGEQVQFSAIDKAEFDHILTQQHGKN